MSNYPKQVLTTTSGSRSQNLDFLWEALSAFSSEHASMLRKCTYDVTTAYLSRALRQRSSTLEGRDHTSKLHSHHQCCVSLAFRTIVYGCTIRLILISHHLSKETYQINKDLVSTTRHATMPHMRGPQNKQTGTITNPPQSRP